jgi:hypothetical protein
VTIPAQLYLNMVFVSRLRTYQRQNYWRALLDWKAPDLKIYAALPLLLFSIDRKGQVDQEMLTGAARALAKLYPIEEARDYQWETVRRAFGTAFRIYCHSNVV